MNEGWDDLSAEEVKNPGRDLPIGIMGSLGVCAALYALMCLVITGMVPTPDIDVDAPFALAFRDQGMAWAESVISFGAVAAITTALLSSLMGQPRVYMVWGRVYYKLQHGTRSTRVSFERRLRFQKKSL